MSYTTGFRVNQHNRGATDLEAIVYALQLFPMNVQIEPRTMRHVVKCVLAARGEVS